MIPVPFVTYENGDMVIRGAWNILWYTFLVQGMCLIAVGAVAVKEYFHDRRRRATRITITTSNSDMSGEYEKVL